MIIGWIADNFFPYVQRGAELDDKILIEEGERRGYEIVKMGKLSRKVDIYIVANCVDTFNIGELLAYLSGKPYINIEHDLRGPQFAWYKMFASEALINVYHSPLQRQLIERFAGKFKHFLYPMSLPSTFKDLKLKRKPKNQVLYVGDYSWEKGYKELVEWLKDNPKCIIWHYGGGFDMKHPRMKEMGIQRLEEMVKIYNSFNSLIFLPHYPQACSRVMAEAYLCKIPNIISNGKDGFTSYKIFKMKHYFYIRNLLINGHRTFWNRLEDLI